jgi:beta-galactosidase
LKVYNENFFKNLKDYYIEWEILADGKVVQTGIVNDIDIAPQQTKTIKLDYSTDGICKQKEQLLNVAFKLKKADQLLPAGFAVAKEQLTLNPYKAPEMTIANKADKNVTTTEANIVDNDKAYIIIKGTDFQIDFSRGNGFISKYDVNGTEMLNEGGSLTPNFWRAPTDNDMGAGLQKKFAAWKNPGYKLTSLKSEKKDGLVVVTADYDMPAVKAKLQMTYVINNEGTVKVTEKMTAEKDAKVSDFFRFGVQMQMPKKFDHIQYYGRGPIENYADRKSAADIGKYSSTTAEQFYSYIRPQENGTRSDIRWWKQTDKSGNGLMFVSEAPFSASALNYSIESLDDSPEKGQSHSELVPQVDYTNMCIDKVQMGLGCVNSWGRIPLDKYMLHHGDYEFTFIMKPINSNIE